jgi:hypothetical protein
MPDTVLIYGLLDPRNGQLRYVGKTVSPKARIAAHKSDLYNARKVAWQRELTSLGLEPKFIIFSEVPFDEWQQHERHTIARYRSLGCPLLNIRAGGGANPKPSTIYTETLPAVRVTKEVAAFVKRKRDAERRHKISDAVRAVLEEAAEKEAEAA